MATTYITQVCPGSAVGYGYSPATILSSTPQTQIWINGGDGSGNVVSCSYTGSPTPPGQCASGLANVGGVCIAECAAGTRLTAGACQAYTCPTGTAAQSGGICAPVKLTAQEIVGLSTAVMLALAVAWGMRLLRKLLFRSI